jgi:sRNA-binding regulator protein Hfq
MKKQQKTIPPAKSARVHRVSFLMNGEEYQAVERHLSKYRITNKSNWYRSIILSHVIKMMEKDYPTLFNENEMRR